jgi:exosortase/archaeosortase family protein
MAWLAYFTACVVALHARRPNASFALRLPAVGAMVLVGNIVRNTVLVAYAGTGQALSSWAHEGVGLLAQALVCGAIVLLMKKETRHDLV